MIQRLFFCVILVACIAPVSSFAQWHPAEAPLMTAWGETLDPAKVLPEYPRPLMVRRQWLNLNGIWEFEDRKAGDTLPAGRELAERILVPFAWESALSGLRREIPSRRAWYRRVFVLPKAWHGQRILMHFGAVDWQATLYINGQYVDSHQGGFDAFYFDITPFIHQDGKQEVIVAVHDPSNTEAIAYGKQNHEKFSNPGRYSYSPVSGIWQTVWLEPVPEQHISDFRVVPDIDRGLITIDINNHPHSNQGMKYRAVVKAGRKQITAGIASIDETLTLAIPKPRLWWPHDPYLYDLELQLLDQQGKQVLDRVSSYFGMRKIAISDFYRNGRGPIKKITLNNHFIFQQGPLDQGYWPDGLFTAPTDQALRWEIAQMKAWGFNMVRKHIKVEPQRWYYWADKLGLLVWQDMPSTFRQRSEAEKNQFELELQRMIKTHWNHPSIINWIVFNEHWGAYDVERISKSVMALDPSRLVTGNSGIDAGEPDIDYEVGHIKDNHHYRPPTNPFASNKRAVVNGEYGAIGYKIKNHIWDVDGDWVHHNYAGKDEATKEYEKFIDMLLDFKKNDELSAAVYTQWTDVENEMNGLYTYDRKVEKLHRKRVRKANRKLWENDLKFPDNEITNRNMQPDGGPETIEP